MTFQDVLFEIRKKSATEREKGFLFEKLMQRFLREDNRYQEEFEEVWLWNEFPYKNEFSDKGQDLGIDLVAKLEMGGFCAIQCKCYNENTVIEKPMVDSFIATSGRSFGKQESTGQEFIFTERLWISTTNKWGKNAEDTLKNQYPPVERLSAQDLEESNVDWERLIKNEKNIQKTPKHILDHQKEAVEKALLHYQENERGKLIMACGTGKTFTALQITENRLKDGGRVVFMVPSIALLGQALNAWMQDKKLPMTPIGVCSDSSASSVNDDIAESLIDLPLPATTNAETIVSAILKAKKKAKEKNENRLIVVFSTYQSIDQVERAQKTLREKIDDAEFDLVICDEAHRTTGVSFDIQGKEKKDADFVKIHDGNFIQAKHRLYMTATPRVYSSESKKEAKKQKENGSVNDCVLFSMDDESVYGKEFYRVGFGYAVEHGLLTDYRVMVLTVSDSNLPQKVKDDISNNEGNLDFDEACKLVGSINALAKCVEGDNELIKSLDPSPMKRAVAFCSKIGKVGVNDSSKNTAEAFPILALERNEEIAKENDDNRIPLNIEARHVDGSMKATERNEILDWLKEDTEENTCRIVTNVRCLSEGVDVPALDAVLFLSPRNSQVDVVQSVGRVMRNFKKGLAGEKRYGYIIIPVAVPTSQEAYKALDDNKRYKVVWQVLNALRSHDDRFNAEIQRASLDSQLQRIIVATPKPKKPSEVAGGAVNPSDPSQTAKVVDAIQTSLEFEEYQAKFKARLVEKCGEREYWETWAGKVGEYAKTYIERIKSLVRVQGEIQDEFQEFVNQLRKNLNPSIQDDDCIEMLAQHMITRPVFEALFSDYRFVGNNSISRSMQKMIDLLQKQNVDMENSTLEKFYESVKMNVSGIDKLDGKQKIIKTLYEKFFKIAFSTTVEKLGIVYTPNECVDFIIQSVNDVLKHEFNKGLSAENVHILDPFTGTGTFIARLLQSGVIDKKDLVRKYTNEIHCNEIVLLAYYVADVNIESVFQEICEKEQIDTNGYLPYDGICLTDTFQLAENNQLNILDDWFKENSEALTKQKKDPITVIIGNPPYSIGQKSANDNAQNQDYPELNRRIADTYVAKSIDSTSKKACYDSYIKAFRWATDRLNQSMERDNTAGGIIGFVTNGAWLDNNSFDGFRKTIEEEFSAIYVFNLRGNCRTQGELRRKEGGNVFGLGSRTPVAVTILVKTKEQKEKAKITYAEVADYLTREQKLELLKADRSVLSEGFLQNATILHPNEEGDWISLRNDYFDSFMNIEADKKFNEKSKSVFSVYSLGLGTNRDPWLYNFSKPEVERNVKRFIEEYTRNIGRKQNELTTDPTKIAWSSSLIPKVLKGKKVKYQDFYAKSLYRPFCKQILYRGEDLTHRRGQFDDFFPTSEHENLLICVNGLGSTKGFTSLMTDCIPDLNMLAAGAQCFPLYWYSKSEDAQQELFNQNAGSGYVRHDAVTDFALKAAKEKYGAAVTKEDIFYYVYGLLHSSSYRATFESDLKKKLPRIPFVKSKETFCAFLDAGRKLSHLHLNYESVPPLKNVTVTGLESENFTVDKMSFAKSGKEKDKSTILYNPSITVSGIPEKAYDYIVNGKSAIEWIMERYADVTNKDTGIRNNANDWATEHGKPRYILDLLLSVIALSVQSVEIVNALPEVDWKKEAEG